MDEKYIGMGVLSNYHLEPLQAKKNVSYINDKLNDTLFMKHRK